jgi:hypothetical protein
MQYVTGYSASTGAVTGAWHYASDYDQGSGKYTPFAYLDDAGDIVINTDSPRFRELMENQVRAYYGVTGGFMPGATYHWSIFGATGGVVWNAGNPGGLDKTITNGAYFTKGLNADGSTPLAISCGSSLEYGFEPPEGFFTVTIDASAK